ncbi:MAG: penicillin-binding transpeptidase domain-containing protein [Parachlamydiaceae bacterium]
MTQRRRRPRPNSPQKSIPEKANVVLNCILIGLIIVALRVWYLEFVLYDEKFEESRKPQRKVVVQSAKRATIRDRFNAPLAINKTAYKAQVSYAPMKHFPSSAWKLDEKGQKTRYSPRKEYIRNLSELLGKELSQDPERVEDLIYSKAALFYNLPYVLKEELSEDEYAKLKILEKDWPGLQIATYSKREYPKGKCGCDIVGYLGAISREEYEKILTELKGLKAFLYDDENSGVEPLPEGYPSRSEVLSRVRELEELAYTAQDLVGKTGIEMLFEEELRGYQGKKSYYTDSKGNLLKELPGGKSPIPGKRILLSISQELQEYAEKLLAQNEEIRVTRSTAHGKKVKNQKQPWIKGGGIVAMDPNTGEIVALATYPRFDPNDFIPSAKAEEKAQKLGKIRQWFESEGHLADLWNHKRPLDRERYDKTSDSFYQEEKWLTFEFYLQLLLPEHHPILEWFKTQGTIKNVSEILKNLETLQSKEINLKEWSKGDSSDPLGKQLQFLETSYNKLLFLDCCRLALDHSRLTPELLKKKGNTSINDFRDTEAAFYIIQEAIKPRIKELHHDHLFKVWRAENEKTFLKEKRAIEKASKSYQKPYLDYLDDQENTMFAEFWDNHRLAFAQALILGRKIEDATLSPFFEEFILLHNELEKGAHPGTSWLNAYKTLQTSLKGLSPEIANDYLLLLRSFQDLNRPLLGNYRGLRNRGAPKTEKHLAQAFYPTYGYGYARSNAFRQAATLGSIFKLITAYEALVQANDSIPFKLKKSNPIEVTDQVFKAGKQTYVGYNAAGKPIPQIYKGGRIPRSSNSNLGKIDLKQAITTSSNLYFALLTIEVLKNPDDLIETAAAFGYGRKTGIDLPGEIKGKLPQDLSTNRTGLYATAIGQHTLVVTPLQAAVMLSSLANGGELLKPQIIHAMAGMRTNHQDEWFSLPPPYDKQNALQALGIDFPLLTPRDLNQNKGVVEKQIRTITSTVPMPKDLQHFLFDSMHEVVKYTQAKSIWSLSKLYNNHPDAISDYIDLKNQIIGKTSTSEVVERMDMDEHEGTNLYTHVWFGGISFDGDVPHSYDKPELVIIVYLKYGHFGKEAAPVAAQMVRKWREIKASRQ